MNASMLAVQDIHNHLAKYITLPDSWRSKNHAFGFVECIDFVVKNEMTSDLHGAKFHSLIVNESMDVSVTKMLILYAKFRSHNDTTYKTVLPEF